MNEGLDMKRHGHSVKILDIDTTEEFIMNERFPLKGWRRYRIEYGGCNEDGLCEGVIYLPASGDPTAVVNLINGMQVQEETWRTVTTEKINEAKKKDRKDKKVQRL